MKPCMFCGGSGTHLVSIPGEKDNPPMESAMHWVACFECRAAGPTAETTESAIARWDGAPRWPEDKEKLTA